MLISIDCGTAEIADPVLLRAGIRLDESVWQAVSQRRRSVSSRLPYQVSPRQVDT